MTGFGLAPLKEEDTFWIQDEQRTVRRGDPEFAELERRAAEATKQRLAVQAEEWAFVERMESSLGMPVVEIDGGDFRRLIEFAKRSVEKPFSGA